MTVVDFVVVVVGNRLILLLVLIGSLCRRIKQAPGYITGAVRYD